MSRRTPKHLKVNDSLEARIREAGRKVLCGSLSLALASTLMPMAPIAVYAQGEPAEPTELLEGAGANEEAMPTEGSGDETPSLDNKGEDNGETTPEPAQENNETKTDEGGSTSKGSDAPATTGTQSSSKKGNATSQITAKPGATTTSGTPTVVVKENPVSVTPEGDPDPSSDPVLTATPSAGEEHDGITYYRGDSLKVTFTVTGNLELAEDGGSATVKLAGKKGDVDYSESATLGNDGTAQITLNEGTYTDLEASVEGLKTNPANNTVAVGSGTLRVIKDAQPTVTSVTIKDKDGNDYKKEESEVDALNLVSEGVLSTTTPLILEKDEATSLVVSVADDALNTDESASYVEVINEKGESVGSKVTFSKDGDVYNATLSDLSGRVGLHIVTKGYGADATTTYVAADKDSADEKYKANSSLIIDTDDPEVESVKLGTAEDAKDIPLVTGGQSVVTKQGSIVVTVKDEWLLTDAGKSYVQLLTSEGTAVEDIADKPFEYDATTGLYKATVDISSLVTAENHAKDGSYKIKVFAKDTFSESEKADIKERHKALEGVEYGPIVIDTTAPEIESTTVTVGSDSSTLESSHSYKGNEVKVTVNSVETHLDTDNSKVTITPEGGTATEYKWTANNNTITISDIKTDTLAEGTYTITVHVQDTAGNSPEDVVYEGVVLDVAAPRIGEFGGIQTDETDSTKKFAHLSGGKAQVTIPVEDMSFNKDKIAFAYKKDTEDYDSSKVTCAWDDAAQTATLTFAEEGTFTVTVSGEDSLGNAMATSKVVTFAVIDAPTVTVSPVDPNEDLKTGTDAQYFNHPVSFNVAINSKYLDKAKTSIAGVALQSITNGTQGTVSFSDIKDKLNSEGTYTVTVTLNEGDHTDHLLLVKARDWYLATDDSLDPVTENNGYAPIVVDTTAPEVTCSLSNTYVNHYDPDTSATTDKILFFKDEQLTYTITDTNGIKSIEVLQKNDDGEYEPYGTYEPSLSDEGGKTTFSLLEGYPFTEDTVIKVIDKAGNSSSWKLDKTTKKIYSGDTEETTIIKLDDGTDLSVQQPNMLIEDDTEPVLAFDLKGTQKDDGLVFNSDLTFNLTIDELNFELVKKYAGSIDVITAITKDGEDVASKCAVAKLDTATFVEASGLWRIPVSIPAKTDESLGAGAYEITAELYDMAGNKGEVTTKFVVDVTAPTIEIAFDNSDVLNEKYYATTKTATIKVEEDNFDASLIKVDTTGIKGAWTLEDGIHKLVVTFASEREHTLSVSGCDLAGNAAESKSLSSFVVDTEDPVLNVPALPEPTGTYGGVNYYSHGITVRPTVKDRNFDANTTTVDGKPASWSAGARDANGYVTHTTNVVYATDGNFRTPLIKAVDMAKHSTVNTTTPFVVDLNAPTIQVKVDHDPTSTGAGNDAKDPIEFFNVATKMTFAMHDDHLLRSYQLDDPDGEYVVARATNNVTGKADASLVIELKDGANASRNTEYERNITLTVEDIAGNRRLWTIDRTGKVVQSTVESGSTNTSINNANVFPVALVQDTTAPVVSLAGVEAGQFYNSPQSVRATVNEFNFDYLKRFDASRAVLHITTYAADAGRAQSNSTVPASSFNGTRPTYTFDQAFSTDGHYEIYAEFLDYANNKSNRASIGEFTIDTTAPTIDVVWNDPAGNAPYYRETRVATITVVEHNFDESLFTVTTTGSQSGWTSNGDTHTMTVTYDADGAYTLSVSGRDKAGNEAIPYNTDSEFYIDKQAPTVTIGGTVQRYGVNRGEATAEAHQNSYMGDLSEDGQMPTSENSENVLQDHHAYNGVVMPAIHFRDQSGEGYDFYDSGAATYTLEGNKHGLINAAENNAFPVQVTPATDGTGEDYVFADFGMLVDQGGDVRNIYDPDADDIYVLNAKVADRAGNEASASVTFSVNRYGSNYVVLAKDSSGKTIDPSGNSNTTRDGDGLDYDLLADPPTIEVTEINVSGSESESDHSVLKEFANKVSSIERVDQQDSGKAGFVVSEASKEDTQYGWSEYHYVIRPGNFGEGSDSDNGDGGQGVYRVNVASVDRASNDISTADYLNRSEYDGSEDQAYKQAEEVAGTIREALKNATASFTLDQVAPVVDELNVPGLLSVGQSYRATVHVTDAITRFDEVHIFLDGEDQSDRLSEDARGNADGTGTYEFEIAAQAMPFAMHEVKVVVSDGIHDDVVEQSGKFMVTTLVPETASIVAVVGAIVGGVLFYRRRKALAEPDMPGSYE